MYKIQYFDNQIINMEEVNKGAEPKYNIVPLEYKCKDEEFEYWLNVIKKTYEKYGKVSYTHHDDPKTAEQVQGETLSQMLIDNMKRDLAIESINKQINNILIRLNKIEGGK